MHFLWPLGIAAAGISIALLSWTVFSWGQERTVRQRTARIRELIRRDEPLLPQLWRHIRVMVSGNGLARILGSFKSFEPSRIEELLADARYPWGLSSVPEVYAIGIGISVIYALGLTYMIGLRLVLLSFLPLVFILGIATLVGVLRVIAYGNRQAMVNELWTLMNGLEIYLYSGSTLYQALREASSACVLLGPIIDSALLKWNTQGPEAALNELMLEIRLPEAALVIGALRQAVDLDPSSVASFLTRESVRLDRAFEAKQLKAGQIKPMIQSAVMLLPMFNASMILIAPIAHSVLERLQGGFSF